MNFRVGQKVVCVDDSIGCWVKHKTLEAGRVYTIRGFDVVDVVGHPGVFLEEVINENYPPCTRWSDIEISYRPERFRPVIERKTDISIFTEMLTPKQRELAPVSGR